MTGSEDPPNGSESSPQGEKALAAGDHEVKSVADLHRHLTNDLVKDYGKPGPAGAKREPIPGGVGLGAHYGRLDDGGFPWKVFTHWLALRHRGKPAWADEAPPIAGSWASSWLDAMLAEVTAPTARNTGEQLARLCRENRHVTTTWRNLADAVNRRDAVGRAISYVQSGAETLERHGWLTKESKKGRAGGTTFYLTRP